MTTPWTRNQIPLDDLMEGSAAQRLVAFYKAFGPTAQGGFIQTWTADEIATVIGLTGDGRVRRVQKERDRLVKKGKLVKVTKGKLYTWDYAWQGISDEALAVLNSKRGEKANHEYVRREETWKASLSDFPDISLFMMPGRLAWWKKLTDLFDMANEEVVKFWSEKFPSAVAAEKLSGFKGAGAKTQAVLFALESGMKRNLDSNPNWTPRDGDVAFVLGMLKKTVGKEKDWKLPDRDDLADMKEAEKSNGISLKNYILNQQHTVKVKKGVTIAVRGPQKPEVLPEGVTPLVVIEVEPRATLGPEYDDPTAGLMDDLEEALANIPGGGGR